MKVVSQANCDERATILRNLGMDESELDQGRAAVEAAKKREVAQSISEGGVTVNVNQLVREKSKNPFVDSLEWVVTSVSPIWGTVTLADTEEWNRKTVTIEEFIDGKYTAVNAENGVPHFAY